MKTPIPKVDLEPKRGYRGKMCVIKIGTLLYLQSYSTVLIGYDTDTGDIHVLDWHNSATTSRHVRYFFEYIGDTPYLERKIKEHGSIWKWLFDDVFNQGLREGA
jgi:hypothetical protein